MSQVVKSQKIVNKAIGVFSQAVADVEKANEILRKGIEKDSFEIRGIEQQIVILKGKISRLEMDRNIKGKEIKKNEELLATLRQFTKEG